MARMTLADVGRLAGDLGFSLNCRVVSDHELLNGGVAIAGVYPGGLSVRMIDTPSGAVYVPHSEAVLVTVDLPDE